MTDAATILAQYGIKRPAITIAAAQKAGLELAVACAMLIGESAGGTMEYGSDGAPTARRTDQSGNVIYQFGGPVTQTNYVRYRAAQRAGLIPRQGVGDAQLTSEEFVARAEQIGPGPWDPYCNQLSGFIGLANRIAQHGLFGGLEAYNGSGPAAIRYANQRMAEIAVWRTRLIGASIPPGDDMAAVPQSEWNDVHAALTALLKPWPGGVSDKEPAKLDDPNVAGYNFVQYLLRNNVEIHRTRAELAELKALVQQLLPKAP